MHQYTSNPHTHTDGDEMVSVIKTTPDFKYDRVNVRTASGALYALSVSPSDTVHQLLDELRLYDIEAAILPGVHCFELFNGLNQKLTGALDYKLSSFGVKSGDELHVRFVPFPAYYVMIPKYQQLLAAHEQLGLVVVDVALTLMGCLLLVFAARCQLTVGQWWSDMLELEYRVPLTLETLAIAVNAAFLGPYLGLGAMVLYILCVVADFKVVAGALGGPHVLYESQAGYMWGMVIASFVAGKLAAQGWDRTYLSSYFMMLLIIVIVDVMGVVWLPFGMSQQFGVPTSSVSCGFADGCVGNLLMWGTVPFTFGHIIKSALGAALVPTGWRAMAYASSRRYREQRSPLSTLRMRSTVCTMPSTSDDTTDVKLGEKTI